MTRCVNRSLVAFVARLGLASAALVVPGYASPPGEAADVDVDVDVDLDGVGPNRPSE
jgi:hypothetical protein